MKRTLFLLLLLLFLPNTVAQAQTAVTLESLDVELWPGYDQADVLVLLTGTLTANTPLPVTLTIPLPEGADFNVMARVTADDIMTDQGMTPQVDEDKVTFTLSESRFRVEYYQPYTASNTQRAFTFSWQSADIAVEQMRVIIQQPAAASDLSVLPVPADISSRQDGLTYHVLPNQAVVAGDTYTAEVDYTMSAPTLTIDLANESGGEVPFLDTPLVEEGGSNWQVWLIGLGGLILVGTAFYFVTSRQSTRGRRPAKPKPMRQAASRGKAKFCHQCGETLSGGDKFCRTCGTAVKAK